MLINNSLPRYMHKIACCSVIFSIPIGKNTFTIIRVIMPSLILTKYKYNKTFHNYCTVSVSYLPKVLEKVFKDSNAICATWPDFKLSFPYVTISLVHRLFQWKTN